MERVYTNHRDGERRIHVEIDEAEVRALTAGEVTITQQLREVCADMSRRWPTKGGTDV